MTRAVCDRSPAGVERSLDRLRQLVGALPDAHREALQTALAELAASLEPMYRAMEALGPATGAQQRGAGELLALDPAAYVATDPRGIIQEVNRTAATLLNRPRTELVGRPLAAFVADEDRKALGAVLKRLVQGGAMRRLELLIKPRERAPVPVALTAATAHQERGRLLSLYWLMHDISERRRAEDALRKSETELRMITSQMPSIVWTTDAELRLQHAVGAGIDPKERTADLQLRKTLYEMFDTTDPDSPPIGAHRQALGGEAAGYEFAFEGRDFQVRVEPLRDAAGRISGCIGVAVDVSERKRAEEKLQQLQAELAHAGRLSILGGMAAGLAHELNQPLTAMVIYAQACLRLLRSESAETASLIEAMEQVAAQGLRAGEMIRRMRTFTQCRTSRRETVDINALMREVASFTEWEARHCQVSIHLQLAEDIPTTTVDAIAIKQVLLSLLYNAIHAMDGSPGERAVTLCTLRLGTQTVEVSVADTGPGLPAEVMEHLFEPFFTTRPNALGVGLSISRSLVEGQGGRLWASSEPGMGARFVFTLPLGPHGAYHQE